jgi:hypothetical protein
MILPIPGVEIERVSEGSITLKMIGRAGEGAPVMVPASAWTRLATLEGTLFKREPYVRRSPPEASAAPPSPPPPPPPICHAWHVRLAAVDKTGVESRSWSQCGGGEAPESRYAIEVARLAVSTRPTCKFEEDDPFWTFALCFLPRHQS